MKLQPEPMFKPKPTQAGIFSTLELAAACGVITIIFATSASIWHFERAWRHDTTAAADTLSIEDRLRHLSRNPQGALPSAEAADDLQQLADFPQHGVELIALPLGNGRVLMTLRPRDEDLPAAEEQP